MYAVSGKLRRRLFGLSHSEATFERRGFSSGSPAQERLEQIGFTFLDGYHLALQEPEPQSLTDHLEEVPDELRGFAYEGAAMGLALRDILFPWKRTRWQEFLEGPGAHHLYMLHVGAGWAMARLRRRTDRALARMDPLLGWLSIDGYGFHEGYFHPEHYVWDHALPGRLSGYELRAFDQGLGRSLWFVCGADIERIARAIGRFEVTRHSDLWSGVGLASAYAGGVESGDLEALRQAGADYAEHLAQGAAFAVAARARAGNPAPHTTLACEILCGTTETAACSIVDAALGSLNPSGENPAYDVWRARIRTQLSQEVVIP